VLDGDSDLDPATNSRKVQPGRSGSGGHQMPIELGRVPATGGCLLIWINDTWVRSDSTSTPLATEIAWKWSRMITRVHRTPRQNNGCLADGRSAERHLRCALNLQACSALGRLGHAANRRCGRQGRTITWRSEHPSGRERHGRRQAALPVPGNPIRQVTVFVGKHPPLTPADRLGNP